MTTEDEWSVPAEWRAKAEPFRGVNTPRPRVIDPEATATLIRNLGAYRAGIHRSLEAARAKGLGQIADAARDYLDAPGGPASPTGAAVVWTLVGFYHWKGGDTMDTPPDYLRTELVGKFLDSWIQVHGLAFAAETVVRRREFLVSHEQVDQDWIHALDTVAPGDDGWVGYDYLALRLREHLALASEDEYQSVVQRLSALRIDPGTVWARLACTYLLPGRPGWLEADLDHDAPPRSDARIMLSSCVTTPEQFALLLRGGAEPAMYGPEAQLYSLLTQVGPAVVPMILEQFGWGSQSTDRIKLLAGILADVPTDEAYQALLARIENKYAAAALGRASDRFPRRAMRLLSQQATASPTPLVVHTLRVHALAHPTLITEYAAAEALSLLEPTKRLPDAQPSELPAALTATRSKRTPKLPPWLVPTLLPQVRLRNSPAAVPEPAAAQLITILMTAASRELPPAPDSALRAPAANASGHELDAVAGSPAPGDELGAVASALDPGSLADFAWAIFDAWQLAAYPPRSGWVLRTLGRVGNDDTVRRLVPFINAWPGESGQARAVEGLGVLAAIGGEIALMHLHSIAKRTRFKSLRGKAEEKLSELAATLGLGDEELADRVVPHLGLSADRMLRLDYGPRQFEVGLDHELRPSITTGGKRMRTLPKPAAADDPELAPVAYQSFRDFAKELKTVTTDQLRRFESAMVDGRRWRGAAHRSLIIDHPVLGQLARRLVWAVFAADGTVTGSFRVDQDGTLADVEDEPLELPEDALVGVAHPVHLGDSLARWRTVFADYELLQPFEQLERAIYQFTPDEAASNELSRFMDRKAPTGRLYGLRQRGWTLGHNYLSRRFGRTEVVIQINPGIHGGYRYEAEEQIIVSVASTGGEFGVLDALTASELLRQLERLTA